jgi:hypothetical protein
MLKRNTSDARVYLSIEGRGERLILDGSLGLLREFVRSLQPARTPPSASVRPREVKNASN